MEGNTAMRCALCNEEGTFMDSNRTKLPCADQKIEKKPRKCGAQTMDKKLFSPEGKNSHPRKRRHNGKPDSVI